MSNLKKYCIANWKMYVHGPEIVDFINKFKTFKLNSNAQVVLCPNYIDLHILNNYIKKDSPLEYGAQDFSIYSNGSYTGDISIDMLRNINCKYSIIGHSERRSNYDETDLLINQKLSILNSTSITPIICIGETKEEKEAGITFEVLNNQINTIFKNIEILKNKNYIIAYEPRWAIGKGIAADIQTIKSTSLFLKNIIKTINENYCNLYLLYGGSVNIDNASEILKIDNIDGFLIGSSSVDPNIFYNIYNKF